MISAKYRILLLFFIFMVDCFAQYQYPYYDNYGTYGSYPVSNRLYSYQPPCRSTCGSYQPRYVSYCRQLPCAVRQQAYYEPHPYSYKNIIGSSNRRVVLSPYRNYYPNSGSRVQYSYPYSNVRTEIIDDESVTSGRRTQKLPLSFNRVNVEDPYANVPVEIIDVDSDRFLRGIPKLPKVSTSSNSSYSVNTRNITSHNVFQGKPVKATITRTFQPSEPAREVRLDFLNGEPINPNVETPNENNDEEIVTTTLLPATTEESEDVSEVKGWF